MGRAPSLAPTVKAARPLQPRGRRITSGSILAVSPPIFVIYPATPSSWRAAFCQRWF
jgi:hypothetical protein